MKKKEETMYYESATAMAAKSRSERSVALKVIHRRDKTFSVTSAKAMSVNHTGVRIIALGSFDTGVEPI